MIEFMRDHTLVLTFIIFVLHLIILAVSWPRMTTKAESGRNTGFFIFAVCLHTCVTLAFSVIAIEVVK